MEFKCEHCEKVFKHKRNLTRHKQSQHTNQESQRYECETCHVSYSRKHDLTRHMLSNHKQTIPKEKSGGKKLNQAPSGKQPLQHTCTHCSRVYNRECDLQEHMERKHSKKVLWCLIPIQIRKSQRRGLRKTVVAVGFVSLITRRL